MMTKPEKCPFCGSNPIAYFRQGGHTAFFPVIEVHIKCEKCGIDMWSVVCHDETSFRTMDKEIESLIERWNRREGREI